MMHWQVALFDRSSWTSWEAPLADILAAERRLLLFARWLARDYVSSTVIKYVGDVKKAQRFLLGMPLESLRVSFHRLPILFKALKKQSPGKKRDKVPWEVDLFERVFRGQPRSAAVGDFGQGKAAFEKATVLLMMMWAFEQLFRMSELAPNPLQTAARDPYMWADIRFMDEWGSDLGWDDAGRPVGEPHVMITRMVPSKTDPGGSKEPVRSPFPVGWRYGEAPVAAGPALYRYMCRYPVLRAAAGHAPLFRLAVSGLQSRDRVTQAKFRSVFWSLCRAAMPEVQYHWYSQFGIHAFRVGGMNRLMDLGATAPQICALGRWEGDCWLLYARRHRSVSVELTGRMATG
jgi:hypothetical protein